MAKYYYTSEDRKTHYDGIIDGKISKPFIGVIYHFWDEIYKGKKNKKGEREGQGTMEWNFDTKGNWRFEDWANNEFWHYSKNPKREYDYEDKLNPDRKLSGNKILFQGEWKDNFPHGKGELLLNGKVFCESTWKGGSLHGKTKIRSSKYTQLFGIFSPLVGYEFQFQTHPIEDYTEIKSDHHLGDFEGDYLYGLATGYGKLVGTNGMRYEGEWRNEFPHGHGRKIYTDGREEFGEFGILDEGTIKLMLDYVEERRGNFIFGTRTFADGTSERVDKRTLYQAAKSKIKDFIE